MGMVADGDGNGGYGDAAGTSSFTKELWNSGCTDCKGDLSSCLPNAEFFNVV